MSKGRNRTVASVMLVWPLVVAPSGAVASAANADGRQPPDKPSQQREPRGDGQLESVVITEEAETLVVTGTSDAEIFDIRASADATVLTIQHSRMSDGVPGPWDLTGAPGCGAVNAGTVSCDVASVSLVSLELLAGVGSWQGNHVNLFPPLPDPAPIVQVVGGPDRDSLNAWKYSGRTRFFGRGGKDEMDGSAQRDFASGGSGRDRLYGYGGNDHLLGGDGSDLVRGDRAWNIGPELPGDDRLAGGPGNDVLYGEKGADLVEGDGGNDRVVGDEDSDRVFGGPGEDWLHGKAGGDLLVGDKGDDVVYGGRGPDESWSSDGYADDVNCGLGIDSAIFDWRDLIYRCERADKSRR